MPLTRPTLLDATARLALAEAYESLDPSDDHGVPLPARPDDARYFRSLSVCIAEEFNGMTRGDATAADRAWEEWTGT